jgi:hypothetical protein
MQDVALRAVDAYLRGPEPETALGSVIEEELTRFAGAVQQLGRWQD